MSFYNPSQINVIIPFVPEETKYFFCIGPANGREAQAFKEKFPEVNVVGFEPSQDAYDFQVQAAFPGELIKKGVYKENTTMKLRTVGNTMNQMHLVHENCEVDVSERPEKTSFDVECVTLDSYLEENPEINDIVVWADIENSEYDMLLGGKEFFKRVSVINVELTEVEGMNDGYIEKTQKLLEEYGFKLAKHWNTGRLKGGRAYRGDYIYIKDK
jgi:FkbM family methyltransferase